MRCITRNVEKEYLSEKTCRGINIAEHAQGLPTVFENTGQQLGVPVPPSSSLYTTSGSSSSSKSHKNPPVIHDGGGKIYDPNISTSAPDGGEYDTSSGYVEPEAEESYLSRAKSLKPNVGRVGDQKRSRSPSDVRTGLSWPPPAALRFSTDDGTEQDADQRSPRKRRRLAKEENEQFSKNTADIMSKLEDDEQMTETGNISISVDRDIVDVLLEEWTVPVY
ncbi:uncharacterized protein J4E92_004023 [Alternaria infectoria]|uniref:uncharacterized protein n=1 Tax=Alternaria triticimaculans TaxID=297637 RepID=UPI0020C23F7E|nr:uncharacterized protein J4E78_005646 [Alternaria triticimaculans]XP_051354435.1 uncharacterized protein J4E92_004023 [Alternaria infectoria]KAI4659220.1 hypothetical protein J4E78_005646 [Alternaria triticimaculans]KAI4932124.1 hypothetical protein J4E92_004023 [Alternaria infectoria]